MTRCSSCNRAPLQLVEPKEAARERVPERIFEIVREFYDCSGCGKVFWVGPKSDSAAKLMESLFVSGRRVSTPLMSKRRQAEGQCADDGEEEANAAAAEAAAFVAF